MPGNSMPGKKFTQRCQSIKESRLSVESKTASLKTIRQGNTYKY